MERCNWCKWVVAFGKRVSSKGGTNVAAQSVHLPPLVYKNYPFHPIESLHFPFVFFVYVLVYHFRLSARCSHYCWVTVKLYILPRHMTPKCKPLDIYCWGTLVSLRLKSWAASSTKPGKKPLFSRRGVISFLCHFDLKMFTRVRLRILFCILSTDFANNRKKNRWNLIWFNKQPPNKISIYEWKFSNP